MATRRHNGILADFHPAQGAAAQQDAAGRGGRRDACAGFCAPRHVTAAEGTRWGRGAALTAVRQRPAPPPWAVSTAARAAAARGGRGPEGAVGERRAVRRPPHGSAAGRVQLLGSDVAPGRFLRGTGSRARGGRCGRSRARRCARGSARRFHTRRGARRGSLKGTAADGCGEPHVAGWKR